MTGREYPSITSESANSLCKRVPNFLAAHKVLLSSGNLMIIIHVPAMCLELYKTQHKILFSLAVYSQALLWDLLVWITLFKGTPQKRSDAGFGPKKYTDDRLYWKTQSRK